MLLLFNVEPRDTFPASEFLGWARRTFQHAEMTVNPEVLGCLKNTRAAFRRAFTRGARLAVMAEEDLVVSADVLEYFTWAMTTYEHDQDIAAVCAHVKESKGKDPAAVVRASWFNPLVCGTWKDRWEGFIDPTWGQWSEGMADNQAWDNNLRIVVRREGKAAVFPALSRVSHIGEYSTIYGSPVVSEYMYAQSVSGCFNPDYPPVEFREVPFDSVPGLLVLPADKSNVVTLCAEVLRPSVADSHSRCRQSRRKGT